MKTAIITAGLSLVFSMHAGMSSAQTSATAAHPIPAKAPKKKPASAKAETSKPAAAAAESKLPPPKPVGTPIELPEWLFPIDPKSIHPNPNPPKLDDVEPLSIPESTEKFTAARINDLFDPPDWHPADHPPMPDIVAKGRKPDVFACAYCHLPTGGGRPENAALAGLPEAYIKEQLEDMRMDRRRALGPEAWKPGYAMIKIAKALTDEEIADAAKYFAQLALKRRVWLIDGIRIPRAEPENWIYKEVDGTEDLGDRLLEVTQDMERHERRDDRLQYTAYVTAGALVRGKAIVTKNEGNKTVICSTCHLANLKGSDKVPPIAGRTPTYLLRQLIAFRNGTRANEASAQMNPVVEKLTLADMEDVVAYVSSLYP